MWRWGETRFVRGGKAGGALFGAGSTLCRASGGAGLERGQTTRDGGPGGGEETSAPPPLTPPREEGSATPRFPAVLQPLSSLSSFPRPFLLRRVYCSLLRKGAGWGRGAGRGFWGPVPRCSH